MLPCAEVNVAISLSFVAAKVLMMPNEIPAATRPYSTAVAPDWSHRKRLIVFNIRMGGTSTVVRYQTIFL